MSFSLNWTNKWFMSLTIGLVMVAMGGVFIANAVYMQTVISHRDSIESIISVGQARALQGFNAFFAVLAFVGAIFFFFKMFTDVNLATRISNAMAAVRNVPVNYPLQLFNHGGDRYGQSLNGDDWGRCRPDTSFGMQRLQAGGKSFFGSTDAPVSTGPSAIPRDPSFSTRGLPLRGLDALADTTGTELQMM